MYCYEGGKKQRGSRQVFPYVLIARLLGCSSNSEPSVAPSLHAVFFLENAFVPFRLLIRTFGECRRCLLQHAIELIKRRKQQGTRGENRVISCDLKRRRPHSYCLTIQVARVSNRFLFVVLLFHFLIPQLSSPTTTPRQPFPPLCSPLPDVLEEEEKCLLLETSTAVAHFQIRKEELDFNI